MGMRFLLAGGAGEVGRAVCCWLLDRGHTVTVLDRAAAMAADGGEGLTVIRGDTQDTALVRAAAEESDVVVNLAWSFSDDAATIFREDIGGHIALLEACAALDKSYVYASSAAVYGTPRAEPVTESHPCLPAEARKPLYAFGKYTAEELCRVYQKEKGLPVTVLRFWWAFGDTVGGRHLREMVGAALRNEPLKVVDGAGGTFVTMDDLAAFVAVAATLPAAAGGVYNLGSLFLTWPEIAAMVIDAVGSRSCLRVLSSHTWTGPAFMNERWRLSWAKAAEVGFRPAADEGALRIAFQLALTRCAGRIRQEQGHG